ncbi:helix-turn-helix domain-containing protein [Shewanella sp. WXL01]|uniref:helix-turn-helix domain-containing protein n=1 Tax=Shewanella sp. WXL01 TaxID=2709721 RepID=UPI00143857EE|nr:helix-turn-helix domain-containing protein [Shewanella sp. WXL01]NKF50811.1 helix-turn-helix domain-containing protein [Shewanella sp. WXL01]
MPKQIESSLVSEKTASDGVNNDQRSELAFGRMLKFWRGVRRMSQEDLAFSLDSSARHISRMENSRVHPSKTMVEAIARAMDLGQRDSLNLMMSAGFTPQPKKIDFHAPELKWLRKAMMLTLRAYDPYPAMLMDASTNILMVNKGWVGFFQNVVSKQALEQVDNHFDFLFSQQGAGNIISGWEDTLSVILMSLQQATLMNGDQGIEALLNRLAQTPNVPDDWQQRGAKLEPMASYRVQMELSGQLQTFFSVSQNVGALGPNAFVSEPYLTVSTLFPEDENLDLSQLVEGDLSHPLLFY